MLTKEQNKRFTEVGPGTAMGELLRRYWLPFATVKQLYDHPTKAISLLGEHLVAFRDRSGKHGLIQEFCPHRNTNLLWGIPEPEGLRCPYHGWMFDTEGHCLEQPAESPESTFKDRINIQAYPVEELGGMLYARGLASGNATKYSPIAQQRARDDGFAVPEGVEEYVARVVGYGQIHPRG